MRSETVDLYKYDELGEHEKEKVRQWFIDTFEYFWFPEAMSDIESFCDQFGVKILDYSISPWNHSYMKTSAENSHFRGLKLKDAKKLKLSGGYYIGEILQNEFIQSFTDSGDALSSFNHSLDVALSEMLRDWEHQYSEESIRDFLDANQYEFLENGAIWH